MTTVFGEYGTATAASSDSDTVSLQHLATVDPKALYDIIDFDRSHLLQFGETLGRDYKTVEETKKRLSLLGLEYYVKRFGIVNGETLVGSGSISKISKETGEFGFWIGKEHIGQGYAPRAVGLMADYSFYKMGLSQVYANVVIGNQASKRVMEKAGFEYVGTGIELRRPVWQFVLNKVA